MTAALVGAYQWWARGWATAVEVAVDLVALVLMAAVVTATTRADSLLDVLARLARPLRHVGLAPETFAMVVGLFLRTVPVLARMSLETRDAAPPAAWTVSRARCSCPPPCGWSRTPARRATPWPPGGSARIDRPALDERTRLRRYVSSVTFQEGGSFGGGRVRTGGNGGKIAAGGGGAIGIVVLLIYLFSNGQVDLTGATSGGGAPQAEGTVGACTAEQANTDRTCRLSATLDSLDTYWAAAVPAAGGQFSQPDAFAVHRLGDHRVR